MESNQLTMSSYGVSQKANVAIIASDVFPAIWISGYNLLQNGLLSSETSSNVKSIPARSTRVWNDEIKQKIKALESVTGILNELTPQQLEIFEKEIKRRVFFE